MTDCGDEAILRLGEFLQTFPAAIAFPGARDQVGGGGQGLGLQVGPGSFPPEIGESDRSDPLALDHDRSGEFRSDSLRLVTSCGGGSGNSATRIRTGRPAASSTGTHGMSS